MVGPYGADKRTFEVDLARLPPSVKKLIFVLSLEGQGEMRELQGGSLRLETGGNEIAQFPFSGSDFGTEKALVVATIYHKEVWQLAAVGQGFAGGLAALYKHFGGQEIKRTTPSPTILRPGQRVVTPPFVRPAIQPAAAWAPPPLAKEGPPKTVLINAHSSFKINLSQALGEISATALWTDNGSGNKHIDDLDLRAGILYPDGAMSIVTCTRPGSLQSEPFVIHLGDVKTASGQQSSEENVKVNARIAEFYGGPVAIVFSVYSAVANGLVSIASLQPRMKLQYGDQIVECQLDFSHDPAAKKSRVYTYVIGLAIIRGGQIEIWPGGQVSRPASELTPWLEWNSVGGVDVTMDGPAVMKGGGNFLAGLINAGNSKRYV